MIARSWRRLLPYVASGAAQMLFVGGLAYYVDDRPRWEIELESGQSSQLQVAMVTAQPEERERIEPLEFEMIEITIDDPLTPTVPPLDEPPPIVEIAAEPPHVTPPPRPKPPTPVRLPTPPLPQNLAEPLPTTETTQSSVAAPEESGAVVDAPPRKLPTNPSPVYPPEARAAAVQGRVVLRATISAEGTIESLTVLTSSGNEALDAAAIAAVRAWRFTPGTREGQPTSTELDIPVTFRLRR